MNFRYFIGLDLGQRQDHSAIAVVEKCQEETLVRYLERVPLATTYPEVAGRVREIALSAELRGNCAVTVDATGVGAPVVEMLTMSGLGCEITAVTITGGDRETQVTGPGARNPKWNVPKRDLMAGVQVLLESGELKIAGRLEECGALVRELMDVKTTVRAQGRVRMGADGPGEHDDLVIALALGVWRAKRVQRMNRFGTTPFPGFPGM